MKCTAIKLSNRPDFTARSTISNENTTPRFTGEEGHSYEFPFLKMKYEKKTTLAITNINLPDNLHGFNTGASLDKWSKKRVRLKTARTLKSPTQDDKDFCYETLETDLSLLLNDEPLSKSLGGSLDNLEYQVHTDIEKLLLKSQRSITENSKDVQNKSSRRRKKGDKKKKNKPKTIKLSKPPSPQTEQVIRVDVTSTASTAEDRRCRREVENQEDNCSKEMIDDKRKELKRNLNESGAEMCDEDFIVRCRQLALRQRRRRL